MNEDIHKQHISSVNTRITNQKVLQNGSYLQNGKSGVNGKSCSNKYSSQTTKLKVNIGKEHKTDVYSYGQEDVHWLAVTALKRFYIVGENVSKNLGQYISVINQSTGKLIELTAFIRSSLVEESVIKIEFKVNPASFSQTSKQKNCENYITEKQVLYLDGESLTCDDLMKLGQEGVAIKLTDEALKKVEKSRKFLEEGILKPKRITYGVNTGFGKFASTVIDKDELELLQDNLIMSTAAGVGTPLTMERTRRMLILRINVLAKGLSGISLQVLEQCVDAYNSCSLPLIPEQGTVGASGDLAPLSHLILGLMGMGEMWHVDGSFQEAWKVLKANGLKEIKLSAKEGIALINGTQMMTALGVEALVRAERVARQADVVACLTFEALKGIKHAFDADLHKARPHKGQGEVAYRLRSLLHSHKYPSEISTSQNDPLRVQDAYTLRCIPQVHGVVNDTLVFVRGILETEMNSATDNPIILADRQDVISGGNFHGEYLAKALDFLAIAVHEISNMSERRTDRMMNPAYSGHPAFLTSRGGLNCGLMIAQYTAAALVSENKVYCHPSSVDSITTCAGTEDHVSMGGWSARKALKVVNNVETVVGVELFSACQALEFLRPLRTTTPLEAVYDMVRSSVEPWHKDRYIAPDIDACSNFVRSNQIWKTVEPFLDQEERNVWTDVGSKF